MAKALSLAEIRKRAGNFVSEWRNEPGEERQQAQSFIRDLLSVFGITKTKAGLYEKRAQRSSTGRQGFIDALIPGLCLIEMKSSGKNLEQAELQALDYVDDLSEIEAPRWVITCDFHSFRVLDLHAEDHDTELFALDDFPLHIEALAFLAGYQTHSFGDAHQEAASIQAAGLMAELYEQLEGSGYTDHEASVFLVRTLFSLYADDAGVWERDSYFEFIETRTNKDGSDLGSQLAMLYQTMSRPEKHRQKNLDPIMARFPYVNGGIFAEPLAIPAFSSSMRDTLLKACGFNWSEISPAIFGSLFQAVKDRTARRTLGEHYTTETNILKTINPLFMDELRERFAAAANSPLKLKRLRRDLGDLRILDPACGCGNFLVVAYRELRELDLKILERLQALGDTSEVPALFFTKDNLSVTLEHIAGIEIEEWPARIAATALHLVDHQANQKMQMTLGKAPDPLPLDMVETIHVGNALHDDWTEIFTPGPHVRIVGNPPFIGHKTRSTDQAEELREVWGRKDIGRLDYVTGWYKKAADYFAGTLGGRFAFVSTNSIAQGEPVPALFGHLFDSGWRIRFAHQTFAWTSEAPGAAVVHCVIVGFDREPKSPATLFTYTSVKAPPQAVPAETINGYLIAGPNVLVEQRRSPLSAHLPSTTFGNMPRDGGHLLVEVDELSDVKADARAAKYLRPFVGARELIHSQERWCLWLVDLDPADVSASPVLRQRLEAVRAFRQREDSAASTRKMAETPHLFGQRSQPEVQYICIPRHFSETRRYATVKQFSPEVICGDANFKAPDPDGLLFGLISSSMFLAWQKAVGGRIKSDLRFSNTLVWNNFPLPDLPQDKRAEIIAAGQQILSARELFPFRSLADHYNPLAMDPTLIKAHSQLDRAVDKAFGLKRTQDSESDRQAQLFDLIATMSDPSLRF
ncbi:DNA methyltransferase [Brevibacterium linens]|uniref:DNA methyltransferase n=3 Tax=Brevibacterium TaxID=1696 RepID=UPI003F89D582